MNNLDPYNFFFELPLYTKISVDKVNSNDFSNLIHFSGTLNAYNPLLKENSTYQVFPRNISGSEVATSFGSYLGFCIFDLVCLRRSSHTITCIIYVENIRNDDWSFNHTLWKVGQQPSVADMHISKVKQYDKVLSRPKIKEFTKAIGLAANGVGIGSFVYLRRIFEDLIEEAHQAATQAGAFDQEAYGRSKMKEKIELLKAYLPEFLLINKHLYVILSLGIHELDEQDCLAHFQAVKVGIEMILDEKVEKLAKQKRIEEAQKMLQEINQKLSEK